MIKVRRLYILVIIFTFTSLFYGCGPLQPYTADDFRGVTYQRYQESPQRVFRAIETVVEERGLPNGIDWVVDSTNTTGNKLELFTNFSSTENEEYSESLRLKASIREDKGTLASFTLQDEDTTGVYDDKITKKVTKPIFDDLGENHLTITNVAEQLEGTDEEWQTRDNFFDRIGFFANADGGISTRYNLYSTSDSLRSEPKENVVYETKSLRFSDLHARVGLAGIQFAEYNYETKPNTDFQQEAFTFNEDKNVGIEKYTYGIDLLPLWVTLLPADKPGFLNFVTRLLSARFRSVKELTQTSAVITEPSIAYPSYTDIDPGDSYSFRTRYRYQSASIPLYLFMANQGHVNIGMAHWRYSRPYAMTNLSEPDQQFVFDGSVETVGPILEIYYEVHKSTLGRALGRSGRTMPTALEGLRVDMFIGAGILEGAGFNIEDGDLAEITGQEDIKPRNYNFELSLSYPIKMLRAVDMLDLSLRIGGEANAFITRFENYHDYTKTDWILNPWFRFSLEFN